MLRSLLLLLCTASTLFGNAQPASASGPQPIDRTSSFMGAKAQDMIYERGVMSVRNVSYVINGVNVMGSPFLYHEWFNGTITTQDGRVITGYKIRYDALNQTIHFNNGKDSLEINEPLSEFMLLAPNDNKGLTNYTFINANRFGKTRKAAYYELLLDSPDGQLLKLNQKEIKEARNLMATTSANNMSFALSTSFLFYNKKTGKLKAIRANGSNLAEVLAIPVDKKIEMSNYDFTSEKDITAFFRSYFGL